MFGGFAGVYVCRRGQYFVDGLILVVRLSGAYAKNKIQKRKKMLPSLGNQSIF